MNLAKQAALLNNDMRPIEPRTLSGKIAAVLSHDDDAENLRQVIRLLEIIGDEMPREWSGRIADARNFLKADLYELEPKPARINARSWLADHIGVRLCECQCGCVVDRWDTRTTTCAEHTPAPLGSLPDCVERDLTPGLLPALVRERLI